MHQELPFCLNGYDGMITVELVRIRDPRDAGFDSLKKIPFDLSLCVGYPAIYATFASFGGTGYSEYSGWLQIITTENDLENSTDVFRSVDVAPVFRDMSFPFFSFGYSPSLFDAPCNNIGSYDRLLWTADAFLTTVPARSKKEPIQFLCGFRWGYIEYAKESGKSVELLPLEKIDARSWYENLPFLRKQYQAWVFE